ncbi:MAG: right-handed parallel beta-helix repeat-containing protein [Promethearchaeota archaeon]|jgi:parallel beta-helix repeat protein
MKSNQQKSLIFLGLMLIIGLFSLHNIGYLGNANSESYDQNMIIGDLKTSGTYQNITIDNLPGSSNNWAWAEKQVWCSGSGTLLDPYIIEGHILNMSVSNDGLKISNSHNKHFVIRNCTFKWNGVTNSIPMTGIYLLNTTDGLIIDNLVYHLGYGIVLEDCQNIDISGNTIYDHVDGIKLVNSDLNNIIGNTANNNSLGIYLYFCDNNTVSGNISPNNTEGIYLEESNNNTISGNTANGNSQNGIYSYFCDSNNITGNTVNDNYDGIKIDISSDNNFIGGNTANDNNRAGIYLADSDYNNITGNTASDNNNGIFLEDENDNNIITGNFFNNNDIGMEVYYSDFNTIVENSANNNDNYGISLEGSNNNTISGNSISNNTQIGVRLTETTTFNTISGNTIDDNQDGIFIYVSLNNTIIGNIIRNNYVRGIHIDEDSDYNEFTENIIKNNTIGLNINGLNDYNVVYKNFFLNNGKHAFDDGTANKWNSTVIGNYWDNHTSPDVSPLDGIVDNPYTFIDGPAGSIDYLPIAEDGAPRITINSPQEGERFTNEAPSLNVEVIDVYVYDMWYTLDGGLNNYTFAGNGTINQTAWDVLSDGSVIIKFYAEDIVGNIAFKEVTVIKVTSTGLDPGVIATIVVVSIGGGLIIVGVAYMYLQRRKALT